MIVAHAAAIESFPALLPHRNHTSRTGRLGEERSATSLKSTRSAFVSLSPKIALRQARQRFQDGPRNPLPSRLGSEIACAGVTNRVIGWMPLQAACVAARGHALRAGQHRSA